MQQFMQTRSGNHLLQSLDSSPMEGTFYLCRTAGQKRADVIEQAHHDMLRLCYSLEQIADSLPALIDRKRCDEVSSQLVTLVMNVHRYEETILFPWLEQHYPDRPALHESLRRLRAEHVEDEDSAVEISEVLLHMADDPRFHAEAAGYMFRGFFEGMRRHVACEKEYLYELLASE